MTNERQINQILNDLKTNITNNVNDTTNTTNTTNLITELSSLIESNLNSIKSKYSNRNFINKLYN